MANHWELPAGAWEGEPAFLIGGGSSLTGFDFESLRGKGHVFAINNAYRVCPWAEYTFFADRRWWDWNKNDPELKSFKGTLISRTAINTRESNLEVKRIGRTNRAPISHNCSTLAGFCSGANGLNAVYLLGADPIFLLGFDMYPGNWHDWHKGSHVEGQHRKKFIPYLEWMGRELKARGVRVFNTNPMSLLRCFPFVPLEEVTKMSMDELSRIEHEKYCRVWEHPEYRRTSPGHRLVELAFKAMKLKPGDTLIDLGAGVGRATKFFIDKGVDALAVDIAENALEDDTIPFVHVSLWEIPKDFGTFDWGYCCDVMEHIPPEKIGPTLASIERVCETGCFFNIATRPDVMGKRTINQPLHLSVYDGEWWRREVEKFFPYVDVVEMSNKQVTLRAMKDAEQART